MADEKRLIDANELEAKFHETKMIELFPYWKELNFDTQCELVRFGKALKKMMQNAPTVDAYTEEQVDSIIKKVLKTENRELEQERDWLKNCLNCEIRNKCPRHCGKVVHGCDHWVYGDPTVHGQWFVTEDDYFDLVELKCSVCGESWGFEDYEDCIPQNYHYCPNCGANMDGDGNA